MRRISRSAKQLAIAVSLAVGLMLIVLAFIGTQGPTVNAGAKNHKPTLAGLSVMPEPKPEPQKETEAETPAEKKPTTDDGAKTKSTPKPSAKTTRRRRATPPPTPESVAAQPRAEGLSIKFKDVAALGRLVAADHVQVVLEYTDGTRFMLPRSFADETVALEVPKTVFDRWVGQGRVSELVVTADLMASLSVHRKDARYLAVLGKQLRDEIASEAARTGANLERSVMVIDETSGRPDVRVALHRR